MEVLAAVLGICALLVVLLIPVGLYGSRQRTLTRRVGSFTCELRPAPDAPWTAGVAQYGATTLLWWRTLSLAPRPDRMWVRETLLLQGREPLDRVDHLGRPLVLVHCSHADERFWLMMSTDACAGLVSWLEAGPRTVGRGL